MKNENQEIYGDLRDEYCFTDSSQFLSHTESHIENVKTIANNLMKNFRKNSVNDSSYLEKFGVPKDASLGDLFRKCRSVIEIHDIAKTNEDPEFLAKHNLDKPMYETIYQYAGQELDSEEVDDIRRLNAIDKSEVQEKMDNMGLKQWEQDFVTKIEAMADQIDRGLNPITNVEMDKVPTLASEFGQQKKSTTRPDHERDLILESEQFYRDELIPKQMFLAENLLTPKSEAELTNKSEMVSKIDNKFSSKSRKPQ